jgi:heptosyltransferase-2
MKILILRFSSIGDIVLTSPVVRNLKKQLPDCTIHYCTKDKFKGIVENNPYVNKVHVLKDSITALVKELKQENFDLIIDLHNNIRTRYLKLALGKKSHTFNKLNFKKWLLVNFKINKMPSIHIVDRYMNTVQPLGIQNDQLGLDYYIPSKDEIETKDLPWTHHSEYLAFAIGAQHATKKLPVSKMVELCQQVHLPIILLGDINDKLNGDLIVNQLKGKKIVFNACGLYKLNQSASIIKKATIVISHDTGLMHIASAFKKNIISIWGNTVPEFGMYPYKTNHLIIENKSLSCRPCSKIGYKECPKGHFKCMNDLEFMEVNFSVQKYFASTTTEK